MRFRRSILSLPCPARRVGRDPGTGLRQGLRPLLLSLCVLGLTVPHVGRADVGGDSKGDGAAPSDPIAPKGAAGGVDKAGKRGSHKLTLAEFWSRAESLHPTLRASREGIQIAKLTLDEQRWLALPSGDMSLFLGWSPDIKCKDTIALQGPNDSMPVEYKTPQSLCLETNASQNLLQDDFRRYLPIYGVLARLSVNIIQPLFTFGKLTTARALGRVGVKAAEATTEVTRGDLAVNVVRAYFGLKSARAALDTVKEGHDQLVKWVQQVDKELESGKSTYTEIDLMRLKVTEAQIQFNVVDAERIIASALAAVRYLAQDPEADVDDSDLAQWEPEEHDLQYYLDAAFQRKPELKQLNALGESLQLYRRLRVAELLPDLGIVIGIGYNVATSVQDPTAAYMSRFNGLGAGIGLGLRMGLDFGPKTARLQRATAELRQYQARRQEALGGGALEIERTYNDLVEAIKRYRAAETGERRARGWLQGIKQNIDVGTAESRDMTDALRSYFDQHVHVLRALNDVNVQAAMLRRLCGLEVIPK